MTIQLFREEEDISLKEYSEDPNYEDYAGIVLDKENNLFKVITGKFKDKKDFYDKMADRGLILRKCFEIRVYNWIKENAKTTLDAYLMLSTAFSKWKGNNMLSDYYNKLLHDIPELNREGQKGNPNTRGKKEEAVLTEVDNEELFQDYYNNLNELSKLFDNTPITSNYLEALAISDPVESAKALIEANSMENRTASEFLKGGVSTSRDFSRQVDIKQRQDPLSILSKGNYNDRFGIDTQSMYLNNDGYTEEYDITIIPVFGEAKEQFSSPLNSPDQGKNKLILYPKKDITDPKYVLHIKGKLPQYGQHSSLNSELANGEVRSALWSAYATALNDFGPEVIGVKVKITDSNGKNVTSLLNNSATRNRNNLQVVTDADGTKYETLPAGASFIPDENGIGDTFFLDRSTLRRWSDSVRTKINYFDPVVNQEKFQSDLDKLLRGAGTKHAKIASNVLSEISEFKKRYPYHELNKKYEEQQNFLAYKKSQIAEANYKNSKALEKYGNITIGAVKNQAEYVINKLETITKNAFYNSIIQNNLIPSAVSYKNYLDSTDDNAEFQNRAYASNSNMSNITQNAPVIDRLMAIHNGKDLNYFDKVKVDKLLAAKNNNNVLAINDKTKKASIKKEPEISKEEKLLNAVKRLQNELKGLQAKANQSQGKDQEINDKIIKVKERLEDAQARYDSYIKMHPSSGVINPNSTGEVNVEEAYVNDGASGYYHDQQNASKNALAGKFITEEITHSELNPALFDGEILKPDILNAFLEIADKFKQTLNISINPVDVYFTGSNANYNYNENSDIDIHLVYDFEQVGIAAEILEKYLRNAKRLFNLDYDDIRIKGIKVEVGYENLATPLIATAVYSLRNNNWVKKPEMKSAEIKDPDTEAYADITSRIESAIQDKNLDTLGALWKEIGELRKQSLNLEGEFGQGNALFKKLRNLGTLSRLRNAYYQAASKDLSLESNGDTTNE